MKRNLFLASLLLFLAACTPSTPTSAPVAPTAVSGVTESRPANPSATEAAPVPVFTRAPSFVKIVSHLDAAVVNTSPVELVGEAPVGAVVSVNDTIVIVGADGKFKVMVALEEGPNVIEIIASLVTGEQTFLLFSLFYEP